MATEKFEIKIVLSGAKDAANDAKKVASAVGSKGDTRSMAGAVFVGMAAFEGLKSSINLAVGAMKGFGDAVTRSIGSSYNTFVRIEDQATGMARTLGITTEEATNLSRELFKIKTPTSIAELQDIGRIAGSMGVAQDSVIDFVGAVDKINVALGDDFTGGAEEITSVLGRISNQFGLVDENGRITADGINRLGSAINTLGADGLATAPFIADFSSRVGGIAKVAGISVTDVTGLGAAFEELGQSSEVTGTTMTQLTTAMGRDIPTFAKIAGKSTEEFTQLFRKDANEAMLTFVEGLGEGEVAMDQLAGKLDGLGVDGSRAVGVLATLSENTDLVRKKQELAAMAFDENSSIFQEYVNSTDTAAATNANLSKALEEIRFNIGDLLNQAVRPLTEALTPLAQQLGTALVGVLASAFETARQAISDSQPAIDGIRESFANLDQIIMASGIPVAFDNIKEKMKETFAEDIRQLIERIDQSFRNLVDYLKSADGQAEIKKIEDGLNSFVEYIEEHNVSIDTLIGLLGQVIEDAPKVAGAFADMAGSARDFLVVANDVAGAVRDVHQAGINFKNTMAGINQDATNFVDSSPIGAAQRLLGVRASGGPVQSGRMYRVNETGAEMFAPSQNGRVLNRNQTRMVNSQNTYNLNYSVAGGQTTPAASLKSTLASIINA